MERNLEVAAQCCLDICHRVISIEKALKPGDYREAFLRMSELGVLPPEFARLPRARDEAAVCVGDVPGGGPTAARPASARHE